MKEIAKNNDVENIDSINLKQYFSIQEVSSQLDLSPSLLRYWEGEFPMLQPRKNRKGNRMYTRKDLELLAQIKYLLKERKFTIKGALAHLSVNGSQIPTTISLKERLMQIKEGLLELKKTLDQETP
ncbi:MAG: MerR family transcriptional regulator [Bacteroidota bacterium]